VMLLFVASIGADEKSDLAAGTLRILKTHCYRCHGQNGSKEGAFDGVTDLKRLVGARVVAGDPAKSRLFVRMSPDLVGDMPADDFSKPTPAEVETVKKWIAAGAPAPAVGANPVSSLRFPETGTSGDSRLSEKGAERRPTPLAVLQH